MNHERDPHLEALFAESPIDGDSYGRNQQSAKKCIARPGFHRCVDRCPGVPVVGAVERLCGHRGPGAEYAIDRDARHLVRQPAGTDQQRCGAHWRATDWSARGVSPNNPLTARVTARASKRSS